MTFEGVSFLLYKCFKYETVQPMIGVKMQLEVVQALEE